MSSCPRCLAPSLVVLSVSLAALVACSGGKVPGGVADARVDRGNPDGADEDARAPDARPRDLGPPCGNGWLDPGEECDKAIPAGQQGACPIDCDDGDPCTEDSIAGSVEDCSARCEHRLLANCCGNGVVEQGEECDDGNQIDTDACDRQCRLPGGHLLLTEVVISPTEAEFVEIFNPTNATLALQDVYLGDRDDYYQVPAVPALIKGVGSDFIVRFPQGALIGPGAYVVVAISGVGFVDTYGRAPDYEIRPTDEQIPDMVAATDKSLGAVAGLTDAGEPLMLFHWDGQSDLVQDLDFVRWGGGTALVHKTTATCVDGPDVDTEASCYLDDTAPADQRTLKPPQAGKEGSLHRCNFREGSETRQGGNGLLGHDETSEDLDVTWRTNSATASDRTPGSGPPPALCD